MIITDPRVDMDIDFKSIGLYGKNLTEAKEDAVDKIEGLINDREIIDPTSSYFMVGVGPRGVLAKLKPIDDIPTFSRESDDAYFAREKKNQKNCNSFHTYQRNLFPYRSPLFYLKDFLHPTNILSHVFVYPVLKNQLIRFYFFYSISQW